MIGFIAAVLTTLSFVPQAWQIIKTKDTSGISLGMYAMFVVGVFSVVDPRMEHPGLCCHFSERHHLCTGINYLSLIKSNINKRRDHYGIG